MGLINREDFEQLAESMKDGLAKNRSWDFCDGFAFALQLLRTMPEQKGVLIEIEMPESCGKCPYSRIEKDKKGMPWLIQCYVMGKTCVMLPTQYAFSRYGQCPLK